MYNSTSIVMTQKNMDFLIRRINPEKPAEQSVFHSILKRIITVDDNEQAFTQAIEKIAPEIVVMDLFIGNTDVLSYIRTFSDRSDNTRPVFIVMCDYLSFRLERELYGAGISAVVSSSTPHDTICSVLCSKSIDHMPSRMMKKEIAEPATHSGLEIMITDILHKIGVPAHIKGYQYLRKAIVITVDDPDIINYITKRLYPDVAEHFMSTPSRVERAMRHAIEVAWDRGDVDFLGSYFGATIHHSRGKPTNSEFIAIIADKIRMSGCTFR